MALVTFLAVILCLASGGAGGYVYGKRKGFEKAKENFRKKDALESADIEDLLREIGTRNIEALPGK